MKKTEEFTGNKMRLLEESLMLIERLRKMRALRTSPRFIGIDPNIIKASGLDDEASYRLPIKRKKKKRL